MGKIATDIASLIPLPSTGAEAEPRAAAGAARTDFAKQLSTATGDAEAAREDGSLETNRPDAAEAPSAADSNAHDSSENDARADEEDINNSQGAGNSQQETAGDDPQLAIAEPPVEFVNAAPIEVVIEPAPPTAEAVVEIAAAGFDQEADQNQQNKPQVDPNAAQATLQPDGAELTDVQLTDAQPAEAHQAETLPAAPVQGEQLLGETTPADSGAVPSPDESELQTPVADAPKAESTSSQGDAAADALAESKTNQSAKSSATAGEQHHHSGEREEGRQSPANDESFTPPNQAGGAEPNDQLATTRASSETAATSDQGEAAEPTPLSPTADDQQPAENNSSLGRLTAGRLSAMRSTSTAESTAPRVDAARFVTRVSRAIDTAQQRGGEIKLRLSPPELGTLQIKLSLSEGALTATLETETASARNLLLDNLPALRDRLAEQQIRVEKFDVDVRQQGSQQQDWTPDDRQERQSERNRSETELSASERLDESKLQNPLSTISIDSTNPQTINLVA